MPTDWLSPERRAVLRRLRDERGTTTTADRVRPSRPGEPPVLSPAQRRLWFFHRLHPGHPLYNVAGGVWLRGALDPAALRGALTSVFSRHDALRTAYRAGPDGEATPVVLAPDAVTLPCTEVATEADALRLARRRAAEPLDLGTSAPVRCQLLRVSPRSHLLVVVVHHLAADGWSLGVLLRELVVLYQAQLAGTPPPLPPLPVQYADWARWQESRLPALLDADLPYWQDALAGAPLLELPADRARPARPSRAGAVVALEALGGLARLAAIAERARTTRVAALLAVVAGVLSRWSGQTDVVLGIPLAGRDRPEVSELVGFFVNTVPIRLDLSGDPPLGELAEQAGRAVLAAREHGDVPYDVLVERLRAGRASGGAIVRHLVQLDPEPSASLRVGELAMDLLPLDTGTAKFDLEVALAPTTDGRLVGRVEYSTELFETGTATALVDSLSRALSQAHPETPVGELALLDDTARSVLTEQWSGRSAAVGEPPGPTLHGLVAAQAARTPGAVAVQYEDVTRTYRELDDGANRLSRLLQDRGAARGTLVGVCLRRGPDLPTALLAVLKAGAAYLPLDPDLPAARIEQLVTEAAVPLVVTELDDLDEPLGSTLLAAAEVVSLRRDAAATAARSAEAPAVPERADQDLAYVIYTSGSTGSPKGAMNEHRAVVNRLQWMQDCFGLVAGEGVLQKTPLGFDVSVWELFWPLLVGARCVLARPGDHRDPIALATLMSAADVTTAHFVPSVLAEFVAGATTPPASLRRLVCSGEELPAELVDRATQWLPQAAVFNLYGPTEAAIDVSWHPAEPAAGPRVPIGRPVAGAALYVVDPAMQPVPIGALGELLIGGLPVGRGYWRRPGLTAERFVPDPFGSGGARLYRTGDLARWRPDGMLEYRGRADRQVKVRGMRVEPGEVEAVLAAHPLVDSAVVDPRPGPGGTPRLVGFVRVAAEVADGQWRSLLDVPGDVEVPARPTPTDLGRLLTPELRAHVRQRLPDYLVPDVVAVVSQWPLSPNGKLDRRRLPEPPPQQVTTAYVPPATSLEQRLAGIWAELLGVDRVGGADDFFELGGHSLLAVRLVARVRAELGVDVRLAEFFAAPTVGGLAAAVTAARQRPAAMSAVRRVDRSDYRVDGPELPTGPTGPSGEEGIHR